MLTSINIMLISKLLILTLSLFILLKYSFAKKNTNTETFTSFFLFGYSVFFVTYFLSSVEISMGFAFGLFAIFSVLRYRTESLGARDMTYLFTSITLSLIISVSTLNVLELLCISALICVIALTLESDFFSSRVVEKHIIYEVIDNIKPENHDKLMADLIDRTGLDIVSVSIEDVNFMNDSAKLIIRYKPVKLSQQGVNNAKKNLRKIHNYKVNDTHESNLRV